MDEGFRDEPSQERRMRLLTLLTLLTFLSFVFENFSLFSLIISSPLLFLSEAETGRKLVREIRL
jgi:hypothetical protein